MKLNNRNLYTRASLILLLVHFATFLIMYLAEFIFKSGFFTVLWYYVQKTTFLLIPLVSGLLTLIADAFLGTRAALLRLIPLSLAKLIYSIPFYYLQFVYDTFYDSVDAILLSLLQSLIESIVLYIFSLIIFIMMKCFLWILNDGRSNRELLAKDTVLDFHDPVSATFMICTALCFVYWLVDEIITTVSTISSYATLTAGEIIYMLVSYVIDIALLALYYVALSRIKNAIIKSRLTDEEDVVDEEETENGDKTCEEAK